MGITMTMISNNLNTNSLSGNSTGKNKADSASNAFSSILAMQSPAQAQNNPSAGQPASGNTTEPANLANNTTNKKQAAQGKQAAGKTNNGTAPEDGQALAEKVAANESPAASIENTKQPEDGLNVAQNPNGSLLAEQSISLHDKPEAHADDSRTSDTVMQNTLLSQLIEPQRNLANRLSGKNQADPGLPTPANSLATLVKEALAGSGQENDPHLSGPEAGKLSASQLAALEKQTNTAPWSTTPGTQSEAASHIRKFRLDGLLPDGALTNPTDPRTVNLKTSTQQWENQTIANGQATNHLADFGLAANTATAANTSVTSLLGQAPASPLVSIGTSFYHPGWSQAMSQQLATQASLFFKQQANGTHIAHMRLDPPELGPIKVSLSIQDGVAQAAFVASNPAVRQALENALADLHQALQEKGLSLGQAHVGQQDNPEGFFMSDQNPVPALAQPESHFADPANAAETATAQSRPHDGLINTFA